ncbi:MAG TPA: archease [Gemmatimonadaceae bacterium]|nr:archease [Gemmatimonadaceae bacterium]
MKPSMRTLAHVGEWRIEVRADSREEVFAEVARQIARAAGPTVGSDGDWERVALAARDDATLLVDWANELIGRGEAAGRAYAEVRNIALAPSGDTPAASTAAFQRSQLTAEIRGRRVPEWRSPLKAATYHGAAFERRRTRWFAALLFDI